MAQAGSLNGRLDWGNGVKGILKLLIPVLIIFGATFGGAYWWQHRENAKLESEAQKTGGQLLAALQKQGKVDVYTARFVALLPSTAPAAAASAPSPDGDAVAADLHAAEETAKAGESEAADGDAEGAAEPNASSSPILAVAGTVAYAVDLSRLSAKDMSWDAKGRKLTIALPAPERSEPEVDAANARTFAGGEWVSQPADDAAAGAASGDIARQAAGEDAMASAREAAIDQIQRSFAVALAAAGVNATVEVTIQDAAEGGEEAGNAPAPAHE